MGVSGALKKSVVIVNEYTVKTSGGGTRGSTPGDYVLRYMGRDGATEGVTPVRYDDNEDYIMRYMARGDAVDDAVACYSDAGMDTSGLKDQFYDIQGQGGVAFGYGEPSLSHKKLKASAKDIQNNFDKGKTVMKTVLSFEEEYLRDHGLIRPDFHLECEGDYRGNIDQMKLRLAIMNGLRHLSRHYDDLQYIGVIQVDTKHVHCHLAMVDRGVGTLMPDGTQRGKITVREKADFRRGIEMYLDKYQNVKMMASSYELDRQNTVAFVKQYSRAAICERGRLQFVVACLPDDRRLWRASSNDICMKKPNALVREYVMDICSLPESGFDDAVMRSSKYASYRREREGLSDDEYRKMVDYGRTRIIESGMNAVYSVLKQMSDDDLSVSTPVLSVMSMPDDDLSRMRMQSPADNSISGIMDFGFRMRSYRSRLDHHKEQYSQFHSAVRSYESFSGQSQESRTVYDYFKVEEEYNGMLVVKYQYLIGNVWPENGYMQGVYQDVVPMMDDVVELHGRVDRISMMLDDKTFRKMKPENAELYGQQVYHESGGHVLSAIRDDGLGFQSGHGQANILQERYSDLLKRYQDTYDDLSVKLFGYGFVVDQSRFSEMKKPDRDGFSPGLEGDTRFRVAMRDYHDSLYGLLSKDVRYGFDDVKALDIHHMLSDFPKDFHVSAANARMFTSMADRRHDSFVRAREYLIASGQEHVLSRFPVQDIEQQYMLADRMRGTPGGPYVPAMVSDRKQDYVPVDAKGLAGMVRTMGIDYDYSRYSDEIRSAVEKEFSSVDFGT